MIISCEKCNKKFELADNLIPESGRLLQCGSCEHTWHYMPNNKIELVNEIKVSKEKIIINEDDNLEKANDETNKTKVKKVGFISYILVGIISLSALVILTDTFKIHLINIIPNVDLYLDSLYETLKDIYLFFTDLLK